MISFYDTKNKGTFNRLVQGYLVLVLVLSLAACAGRSQRPDADNDLGARPLKQAVPGLLAAQVAPAGLARPRGIAVPSHVNRNPAAFYRRTEPAGTVAFPDFERPRPSANSLRGKGMPSSQSTTVFQGNVDESNSWTGSSGGFDGTDWDDNGVETDFVFIPPDPHAAAGPDHVVSVVNVMIQIRNKHSGVSLHLDSLQDFFTGGPSGTDGLGTDGPSTFTFDPKVLYDQYEDRWVVITMEQDTGPSISRLFIAVSENDDPMGTWYMTVFDTIVKIGPSHWADYPGLAVDDKAIYITANLFSFAGNNSGGVRLWIIDKGVVGGFYDNGTADINIYDPYAENGGLDVTTQPAHMYGIPPADLGTFLVGFSGIHYTSGLKINQETMQVVIVEDPLDTPIFVLQYVDTGDIETNNTSLPDAEQKDTTTDIEVNDRRTLDAVWRDNSLWFTTTILPFEDDNSGETTAYWVKIDTSTLLPLVLSDKGEIGVKGTYTFFPSIAVDGAGNMVTGFSASGSTIYPGAYFVTRSPGDAAGTTSAFQIVKEGTDYYIRTFGGSSNRWGDYSATVVDSVEGCFWIFNEWADTKAGTGDDGRWGTAYIKTCVCSSTLRVITANQWESFSLPCSHAPDDEVRDIFPLLDEADYGITWIVAYYDADAGAYVFMAVTDLMMPGVGYWVYSAETVAALATASTDGSPHPSADIPLVGVAGGQFNLLGNDQNGMVDWADFQVIDGDDTSYTLDEADPLNMTPDPDILQCDEVPAGDDCLMSRIMYKWNGASYDPYDGMTGGMEGSLVAHETFWVKAFEPGIFLRSPTVAAAAPAAESSTLASGTQSTDSTLSPAKKQSGKSSDKKKQSDGWYVRLIATAADLQDSGNVFGQSSDSQDGLDIHDLETIAPFSNTYLDILFTNPLLGEANWGFASDYRALTKKPSGVWPFVVRASAGVSEVTLNWEGEKSSFKKAWLLDEQTDQVFRIKPDGSYSFIMDADGESHFTIMLE